MSEKFIWLWIILILMVIIGIGIFLIYRPPNPVNPPVNPQVSCVGNLNELPEVTNTQQFQPCCDLTGNTNGRYYDMINDWTVIESSPADSPPSNQVCLGFCAELQLPDECNSKGLAYNNCISATQPNNCSDPATPVARLGTTPYYVIGRGKVYCISCVS